MILVVDDHPVVRQGMECILQVYKPDEKIVQAGSIKEAMEQMHLAAANMVFVDINLNHENGFAFIEWLQEEGYSTKIFIITSSSRESDYMWAKQKNADAYLLKEDFIDDVLYALKVVERGEKFYSPAIKHKSVHVTKEEELLETLTEREFDVLVLLSQAYSNAQISETLYISEGTAKRHVTSLLSKLGLESRMEAMLFAGNCRRIQHAAIERRIKADQRRQIP